MGTHTVHSAQCGTRDAAWIKLGTTRYNALDLYGQLMGTGINQVDIRHGFHVAMAMITGVQLAVQQGLLVCYTSGVYSSYTPPTRRI